MKPTLTGIPELPLTYWAVFKPNSSIRIIHSKLLEESKRERQVLLDIVKIEQKHNQQLREGEKRMGYSHHEETKQQHSEEEVNIDESSLHIEYDSYDEREVKYNYEIDMRK